MDLEYNITYRQKDKGWQYIISCKQNGIWKQIKSKQGFKKKSDAKPAAEDVLKKLKKDNYINVPKEFKGITFKEFGEKYFEHSKLYNQVATILSTRTVLKNFSALNDMELSKITTLDIQKIVDGFVKDGLKTNTIKYYVKKLSIIFNAAKNQYNIINTIPTHKIIMGKMNEIHKRALTEDEVQKLLFDVKKNKNSNYYLLVFIAVNTGMRIGEILGLKWNDIDFKERLVRVDRQWKLLKDGTYGFGTVKSKNSKRIIPVSNAFCNELIKYRKIVNIDARILNFKNTANTINRIDIFFKKYGYNISFHELRHTYATKLIAHGMDFKTAAKILGHDVQQTIKIYSHVNNDMMDHAKNLIENIF